MTGYSKLLGPEHHKHQLTLVAEAEPFTCNGCLEFGHQLRYTCKKKRCHRNFHLHRACVQQLGMRYQGPFYCSDLVFRESPTTKTQCLGCGRNVNGYAYECGSGKSGIFKHGGGGGGMIVLHPCCADLPAKIEAKDCNSSSVVTLSLKEKLKSRCCRCGKKKFRGQMHTWGYVSADKAVQIHVACANDMFREMYDTMFLQKQSRTSRLKVHLMRMLNDMISRGGAGENETATGSNNFPELPISVPEGSKAWDRKSVLGAVWWTICTVGAVIAGDPISISQLLLELLHLHVASKPDVPRIR